MSHPLSRHLAILLALAAAGAGCVRRAAPGVSTTAAGSGAPPPAAGAPGPAGPGTPSDAGGTADAPTAPAAAADPAAANDPADGSAKGAIVLRAARMFTGTSERATSPGLVVIVDGKIAGVGSSAAIPPEARVIDLGDATLLPGLLDAHTHLTDELDEDWQKHELDRLKKTVAELAAVATAYARTTVRAGFTTVRDLGSEHFMDVGLRNAIRAGHVAGPRMLVATHALGALGGHCDYTGGYRPGLLGGAEPGIEHGIGAGPHELRAAVRHAIKHGADVIKVCATGGVLSLTGSVDAPQLTQEELDAIVDEARALGRRTAAHAHGAEGAKRAIRAGVASIEHGTFLDDEALRLMKARGTMLVWTPTPCLNERLSRPGVPPTVREKWRRAAAAVESTLKRALARGVRIAYGSDAAVCPHGDNAAQFPRMVELGMRPGAALRAATAHAAELLGVADELGTLASGKLADVIAVPGDPLRDISAVQRVSFVMKGGQIVRHDAEGR